MPVTTALVATAPAYAIQYLSISDAQKLMFPEASEFKENFIRFTPNQIASIGRISGEKVPVRGQQIWKALEGDSTVGYFILDYVIGKHLVIDYAVALEPDGRVRQVEILEYRESYGGEIRGKDWRKQFVGKTTASPLQLNGDIINISGATLSCRHVTEGVKRVLAVYESCIKGT